MTGTIANPLLAIDQLTKSYDGVRALRAANLTVGPSEIHALLGENGAGKSTLIKILAGAIKPDAGTIMFSGKRVDFASRADSIRSGISVIFQRANLVPQLTVAENVVLGSEHSRMGFLRDSGQRKAIKEVLGRLGADIDLNRTADSLRSSERQLVEIARALLQDARLLILDEPTASLGSNEVDHLHGTLINLRTAGLGIIYVSHRLEEVLSVSDRITVLRDGQTVGTRLAAQSSTADVIKLMIGRDASHVFRTASHARDAIALKVRNLSTATGLKDISFDLHAGEILGVFGLLGSGRTELARALFGADPVRHGTIEVATEKTGARRRSPYRAARSGMGFVPEERTTQALFPLLSITDNMTSARPWLFSAFGFIRDGRRRELVVDMARRVRLKSGSIGQAVSALSGGNQQKVVLARWMLGASKILILDDPTVGVDVGAKEEIYRLISELTTDGTGVLLMSSELSEVIGLSDRVLVMFRGALNGSYTGNEVREEVLLRAANGEAA
jgi:ABC-type sugar transport system ATPase subunit